MRARTALIPRFFDASWSNRASLQSPAEFDIEYIVSGGGDAVAYLGVKVASNNPKKENNLTKQNPVHRIVYDRESTILITSCAILSSAMSHRISNWGVKLSADWCIAKRYTVT